MAAKSKVQPAQSEQGSVPPKDMAASSESSGIFITGQPLTATPQTCPPPPAPPAPAQWPFGNSVLRPGDTLTPGMSLFSSNGRYKLEWQNCDGNLVFTDAASGKCTWCTDTQRYFAPNLNSYPWDQWHFIYCEMQPDGNFVMHNPVGDVCFQTDTANHPGAFLLVSEDGNVVIIDQNDPNFVIWHRGIMPW